MKKTNDNVILFLYFISGALITGGFFALFFSSFVPTELGIIRTPLQMISLLAIACGGVLYRLIKQTPENRGGFTSKP